MSFAEDLCYTSLIHILQPTTIIRNYRPDWLVNPKTGKRLEIDIWLEEFKIGIEIQGDHHIMSKLEQIKIKEVAWVKRPVILNQAGLERRGYVFNVIGKSIIIKTGDILVSKRFKDITFL